MTRAAVRGGMYCGAPRSRRRSAGGRSLPHPVGDARRRQRRRAGDDRRPGALRLGISVPASTKPCAITRFRRGTLHGYALFLRGSFGAVFFDRGAIVERTGIRIGSRFSLLAKRYGSSLRGVPAGSTYFVSRLARPHWQLRFDLDARRRVRQIGFGGAAVHFVGGCGY